MVIAATVGAGPDIVARAMGIKLTEAWGEQIVVDNRAGASGLIGAETVAKAAPDGHTLWLSTLTQVISTTLHQRLSIAKEFAPVGLVATTPYILAANAALPVKSMAELIEYAKARPGQLLYGSGGEGSTGHLCMEILAKAAGVAFTHVPYKSSPVALTDMMAGQIHLSCVAAPAVPPFVKSGKVRALAVTSATRTQLAPGLPTVAETVPGYDLTGWYGMLAPRGTPPEIIARINAAMVAAVKSRDLEERLLAVGAEPVGSTPAEFGAFLRKETGRWGKALKDAGVKPPS